MTTYARGEKAWGICQKDGLRYLLRDLVRDDYYPHLLVCRGCHDGKHPQERLEPLADAVALFQPSPEQSQHTPAALEATLNSPQIDLSWSPATSIGSRFESYKVMRASGSGEFEEVNSQSVVYDFDMTVLTQPASYADTDIVSGTTYRYYVLALDSYGRGVASNIETVSVPS